MDNQVEEASPVIKESRLRSILKATSWRVLATLTTIVIAYAITGALFNKYKVRDKVVGS